MERTCSFRTPSSLGTQRVACSLGNGGCIGRAFASAATKSGSSSGTAPKCKLYHTTRWWGPQSMRVNRRSPFRIHFNACWLTRWKACPLMPRYRAFWALHRCASMMEASTTCTVWPSAGGVEHVGWCPAYLHLCDRAVDGRHPHRAAKSCHRHVGDLFPWGET